MTLFRASRTSRVTVGIFICSVVAVTAVRADDARPAAQDAVLSTAEGNKDDLIKGAAASRVDLGGEQPTESVTPSGAFQYQMPIAVPKGMGGLAPQLALVYHSGAQNGLAGIGWTLSGLPVITRNKARGELPNAGGTSAYFFNQNGWGTPDSALGRLVPDGSVANRYSTVEWMPSRIFEPIGTCGDGPCGWQMRDGSGTTYFFGHVTVDKPSAPAASSDAAPAFWERVTPAQGGQRGIIAWLLERVVDVHGNEYDVHYRTEPAYSDAPFPSRIEYSLHDGSLLGPTREILFDYEGRPDRLPVPTLYRMRLKTITVRGAGSPLFSYGFDYEQSSTSGRSRLRQMQKVGSDGLTSLPPYKFQWQEGPAPAANFVESVNAVFKWKAINPNPSPALGGPPPTPTWEQYNAQWYGRFPLMVGDVNGDGHADLVAAHRGTGGWFIQTARGGMDGHFLPSTTVTDSQHPFDYDLYLDPNAGDACKDISLLGDINGDGYDDVVFVYIGPSGVSTWISYGSATGAFAAPVKSPFAVDGTAIDTTGLCKDNRIARGYWQAALTDVNGDRLIDLVLVRPHPTKPIVLQALGSNAIQNSVVNGQPVTWGPGLGPFQQVGGGVVTAFANADVPVLATSGNFRITQRLLSGDFNGDGIADIAMVQREPQTIIQYWLGSHSMGLVTAGSLPESALPPCTYSQDGCRVIAGDFDGDGRTDIFASGTVLFGDPTPGATLQPVKQFGALTSDLFVAADWNGDGIADLPIGLGWLDGLKGGPPEARLMPGVHNCSRGYSLNGDDKSDCLAVTNLPDESSISVRFGTPTGLADNFLTLADLTTTLPVWTVATAGPSFMDAIVADVNNDGLNDIIVDIGGTDRVDRKIFVSLTGAVHETTIGDGNKVNWGDIPDLLTTVDNGIGGVITATYQPVSAFPFGISPYSNVAGGQVANTAARQVVARLEKRNGLSLLEAKRYNYERGDLTRSEFNFDEDDGFEVIHVIDDQSLEETVTHYMSAGFTHRLPSLIEDFHSSGKLRQRHSYDYSDLPPFGYQGVFGPSHHDVIDYEQGAPVREAVQSFTYGKYGKVIQQKDCTGSVGATPVVCMVTTTDLTDDEQSWFLGRVDSVRKQVENGVILDWERRYYAPKPYLLEKRERLLCDDAQTCVCAPGAGCPGKSDSAASASRWVPVEQEREHDPAGNLLFHRDALGHGTLYGYDYAAGATEPTLTDHVVFKNGQPVHIQTTRSYGIDGSLQIETSENGDVTAHFYDTVGRKTRIEYPDGGADTFVLADLGKIQPADPDHSQRLITVRAAASDGWPTAANLFGRWTQELFDGRGVVYHRRGRGDDGKIVDAEREERYETTSRVVRYAKPHLGGAATEWVRVAYLDDRVTDVVRLAGVNTTLRKYGYYTDHTDEFDALNNRTTLWRDVRGRVVKAVDALNNTTTYTYDDGDRIRQIAQPNGDSYLARYDSWGREHSLSDTWTGSTTTVFDDVGNVLTRTDARLKPVTFTWDEMNRKLTSTTSEGTTTFVYDGCDRGAGRLCTVTAPDHTEELTYDERGRVRTRALTDLETQQRIELTWIYDVFGRLQTKLFPGQEDLDYEYTDGSNLKAVYFSGRQIATFGDYSALGKPGFRQDGSGTQVTYLYTDEGMLYSANTVDPHGQQINAYRYTYDLLGNVLTATDQRTVMDVNESQTFTYDALSRLKSAVGTYGVQPYDFDATGIPKQLGALTVDRTVKKLRGYLKLGTSQLDRITAEHDVAGFVAKSWTPGGAWTYDYDDQGRLRNVRLNGALKSSLSYDAAGQRYKKTYYGAPGGPVTTLYLDGYELRLRNGATAATRYLDAPDVGVLATLTSNAIAPLPAVGSLVGLIGQPLSGTTTTGLEVGLQYYYENHLGSVNAVTDDAGRLISRYRYEPFGSVAAASRGYRSATRNFTGQELDEDSGLLYYGARYYQPLLARFLSADSIIPNGPLRPAALNRYAYVFDNPVRYQDPTGHEEKDANEQWHERVIDNIKLGWDVTTNIGANMLDTALVMGGNLAPWTCGCQVDKLQERIEGRRQDVQNDLQLFRDGADSRRLAQNMIKDGIARPAETAAHHIVALEADKASIARSILAKFKIGLNEAVNGVFLPNTQTSAASGIYHRILHTDKYYQQINDLLKMARNREEAMKILQNIRTMLLKGTFDFK